MVRNISWLIATVVAVALALAYPTSANEGVPLGRNPGATAPASTAPVTHQQAPHTPEPVPASTVPVRSP